MTDNTIQPDPTNTESEQPVYKNRLAHVGGVDIATTRAGKSDGAAKPATLLRTVKGQKYIAPSGRHSQQSHRRAQERAAAQGHATVQEQHDHDRNAVKAEVSRVAALHATQKPNAAK